MSGHDIPIQLLDGGSMDVQHMDTAMNLDDVDVDLFGDSVMVDTALDGLSASRPMPSKHLRQRLDDLRTHGCHQAIAWSRQGTIASITKDGRSVEFRFLRCRPEDAGWELSEPYVYSTAVIPMHTTAGPIVHLAWSNTHELAVVDAVGRITILNLTIMLNRPFITRKWDGDPVDDLHAVVGCYWLPVFNPRQFNSLYGPAVWVQPEDAKALGDGLYKYEVSYTKTTGPHHPNPNRNALVSITTNGLLRLVFLNNNGRLEETAIELESITSSDDLITHAALCNDRNTLLIALATASKQLRIVRAMISWGNDKPSEKQAHSQNATLTPSMLEHHVAVAPWLQHDSNDPVLDESMSQLSLIEFLPSIPKDKNLQAHYNPVVLTVRSHLPVEGASLYEQEPTSVIDRWEVVSEQPQTLHPAFAQLNTGNSTTNPNPMTRLRKLDSVVIPKIVVSVQVMYLGKVVCFAFSDGTIQYRDRVTMMEMFNEHSVHRVLSPHDVGFQYANDTPCLQVAFSPTNCSYVQISEDWDIKWNSMRYTLTDPSTALQGAQQSAVMAALILALSSAITASNNFDDILAMARPFNENSHFAATWVRDTVNILKMNFDFSDEAHHDALIRNPFLQMCLSILNHMSFRGEFRPRSYEGKLSFLILQVRNFIVLVSLSLNAPKSLGISPLDESEVVEVLVGCVTWAHTLMGWMVDCLFDLADDPAFMSILNEQKRFPDLASFLKARGDVSLHLLCCSSARGLITVACRRLAHLEGMSFRAVRYWEANRLKTENNDCSGGGKALPDSLYFAYQKMQHAAQACLIKVQEFERILQGFAQDVRTAYQTSLSRRQSGSQQPPQQHPSPQQNKNQQPQNAEDQFIKKAQAHCELDMLLGANPPPCFREVLLKFFTQTLPVFKSHVDPAKLYFANYEILDIEENPRILAARKARRKYIDVFTRREITFPTTSSGDATRGAGGGGGEEDVKREGAGAAGEGQTPNPNTLAPGGGGISIKVEPGAGSGSTPSLKGGISTPAGGGGSGGGNPNKATGNNATGAANAATNGAGAGGGGANNNNNTATGTENPSNQWRRCVRCTSVMEDSPGNHSKAGFTFVLAQQRKCSCGAWWALVPKVTTTGSTGQGSTATEEEGE
ncbi:mediator complex subunit 16-domain-containing protein [Copromyces sp. CBS 386.78]|nr:mediator complex subunit 16-domain-containing protein [Copromyces sp. CBS 386.78]